MIPAPKTTKGVTCMRSQFFTVFPLNTTSVHGTFLCGIIPMMPSRDCDSKFVASGNGVWYPRAGTLGGCTAHNAMITVLPQDSDWNYIAQITGDASWNADKMNSYFERLENCSYVPRPGSLPYDGEAAFSAITEFLKGHDDWKDLHHGHGFDGWLTTSEADPRLALGDKEIVISLLNGIKAALEAEIGNPILRLITGFDPNDYRNRRYSPEGISFTPLAVDKGKRNGPREYLLRTKEKYSQHSHHPNERAGYPRFVRRLASHRRGVHGRSGALQSQSERNARQPGTSS